MGNVPGSAPSCGGMERPPKFPNSDEQLLSEEGKEKRCFIGRGEDWEVHLWVLFIGEGEVRIRADGDA